MVRAGASLGMFAVDVGRAGSGSECGLGLDAPGRRLVRGRGWSAVVQALPEVQEELGGPTGQSRVL